MNAPQRLPLPGPEKGSCEGIKEKCSGDVCPVFGTLLPASRDGRRRVRGCDDAVARGKRNKTKGRRKQATAVRALGIPRSNLSPGHEELLGGTVRTEVKAGAQVKPVLTKFLAMEAQSEAARPVGDHRPFVAVVMPDGMSDGIALIRLSALHDAACALVEQWGDDVA